MSIFRMCDASTPGAVRDEYWSKQREGGAIFLQETHKGLVISLHEINGHDDSDFYAVVWNDAEGKCEQVTYGTTRAWTYPNYAVVDATPDVRAKVEALHAKQVAAAAADAALRRYKTPDKGKQVRVIKARSRGKDPVMTGVSGEVFYFGADRFARDTSRYLNDTQAYYHRMWKDPREGMVVGFKTSEGRKVFINAMSVEVFG